jgi:hypothetical protein
LSVEIECKYADAACGGVVSIISANKVILKILPFRLNTRVKDWGRRLLKSWGILRNRWGVIRYVLSRLCFSSGDGRDVDWNIVTDDS